MFLIADSITSDFTEPGNQCMPNSMSTSYLPSDKPIYNSPKKTRISKSTSSPKPWK